MKVYLQLCRWTVGDGIIVLVLCLALAGAAPAGLSAQEPAGDTGAEPALIKPLAARSLLLGGSAVDGLMVAVGERGHILVSRDEGSTWSQVACPTRATLTAVFMLDDQSGWAVGHDATILRTRDGGETWELLHYAPEEERPFLDVWFEDEENGFAIGAYGYFLATTDGGDSWFEVMIAGDDDVGSGSDEEYDYYDYGADLHLNDMSRSDNGHLYIAAEAGVAYRSDDEGVTWTELPSPYEGSFFGTLPLEGDSLLLFGLRGHLFRSENAGETWEELDSGTQALLTDGLVLADDTVVVVGLAGTVLVSTDGGRSFAMRQQADRQGLTAVLPGGEGGLVLLGESGATRLEESEINGRTGQ